MKLTKLQFAFLQRANLQNQRSTAREQNTIRSLVKRGYLIRYSRIRVVAITDSGRSALGRELRRRLVAGKKP